MVGVVALLLATACSSSKEPPSQASPSLGADAPAVGACRVLDAFQLNASSNRTETVPCAKAHTSVTILVGGFPAGEVTNRNLTNGTLGNQALVRCTDALHATVGGDVAAWHLSVVRSIAYLPDPDQLADGAHWFRCDLVEGGNGGMALEDLPAQVKGLLDGTLPDSLRACRTAPDFDHGHQVPCDQPHVLRAVGVVALPSSGAFSGAARLREASSKACLPVVRQAEHGEPQGYAYQWPDAVSWQLLHDRTATCWAVDTR